MKRTTLPPSILGHISVEDIQRIKDNYEEVIAEARVRLGNAFDPEDCPTPEELFRDAPRDFALKLVEDGMVSVDTLALACLKFMSHDDVRDMLDANELSPRFSEGEDTDD